MADYIKDENSGAVIVRMTPQERQIERLEREVHYLSGAFEALMTEFKNLQREVTNLKAKDMVFR